MNNLPINTIIIDFHGTITDHNQRLLESIRGAAAYAGMPQHVTERIISGLNLIRVPGEEFRDYVIRVCKDMSMLDILAEDVLEPFFDKKALLMDEIYTPVDGIFEVISTLKELGVRIIYFTNGTIKKSGAPLHLFPEAKSYSDIIYSLLVDHWHLYSEQEVNGELDIPFVISARDDMDFMSNWHRSRATVKPDFCLVKGLASAVVASLGGEFDYAKTLIVGDYGTDAEFAQMAGSYFAYHLKGQAQLMHEFHALNGHDPKIHPYLHIKELVYLALTGGQIHHEFFPIYTDSPIAQLEGVMVKAYFDGKLMYSIQSSFIDFGKCKFTEVVSPKELLSRLSREFTLFKI